LDIGAIWDLIILQPIINVLITLSHYLFGSFGLAIIVLTLAINAVMYPLTRKQMHATKASQDMQPKLAELKRKHGKDTQALAQEQMKLYRESGLSPAGCLLPMLLQMPIWIALYQAIIRVMAVNPESFANLSHYLYSWNVVYSALPLNNSFLWLDLATPDMLLAILVGAFMWVQQKMTTTQISTDPQQRAQSQTMQVMMPLMFTFLSLSFPSGLALYWVTSNIIRIIMQYFFSGWGGLGDSVKGLIKLLPLRQKGQPDKSRKTNMRKSSTQTIIVPDATANQQIIKGNQDERIGDKRKDGGGSHKTSSSGDGGKARPDRNRGPKRG
jgi:YidC/Oxa1 family membrane protein insertase